MNTKHCAKKTKTPDKGVRGTCPPTDSYRCEEISVNTRRNHAKSYYRSYDTRLLSNNNLQSAVSRYRCSAAKDTLYQAICHGLNQAQKVIKERARCARGVRTPLFPKTDYVLLHTFIDKETSDEIQLPARLFLS